MSNKLIKFLLVLTLLIVLLTPGFLSAGWISYSGFSLKPFKGNTYTGNHSKQTTNQYIVNNVTALTDTDCAQFWATLGSSSGQTEVSGVYTQYLNSTLNIPFTSYLGAGTVIAMGMQNGRLVPNYAWVSGRVDFK
ncbi:MAG: hypothetical protein PHQ09_03475 [Actinomycetota bacterium]|nr:hypothetical protein [Actinomycetota bacterium]